MRYYLSYLAVFLFFFCEPEYVLVTTYTSTVLYSVHCTVQVITNNEMLAIQLPAVCDNISAIPIENILSLKTIT